MSTRPRRHQVALGFTAAVLILAGTACKKPQLPAPSADASPFARQLGADNDKIRRDGEQTFVFAGTNAATHQEEWFAFTGAPIAPAELQYGIGKDRIRSIDDPVYVSPDDPRLMDLPTSPYRREERPTVNDEIMVIGWTDGDEVRAFPTALLDRHELVNDRIGGKPVTVGW